VNRPKMKGGEAPRKARGLLLVVKVRLKELSEEEGNRLTMEWLAKKSKCTSATLRNSLTGRNSFNPGTRNLMLHTLGWGENDLYGPAKLTKIINLPHRKAAR
jgi:hypothetical protein